MKEELKNTGNRRAHRNPGRREAFKIIGGLLLSGGGAVAMVHSTANRERRLDEWVSVGPVADLPVRETLQRVVPVTERGDWLSRRVDKVIWIRRDGDDEILVLNGTCPHENCISMWRPENKDFFCGCHKSAFDSQGKVVAGPAARAMDRLEHRIENGMLLVRCQNFKKKIPTKEVFAG